MKPDTAAFIANAVAERLGLSVEGKMLSDAEGEYCEFIPTDGHPNETFAVRYRVGWRSAEASFVPGEFSGQLIAHMGKCNDEAKQAFAVFVSAAVARKMRVAMRINGADIDAGQPSTWPTEWTRLELSIKSYPLVVETDDCALHNRLGLELVVPLFGMMTVLIGVEEAETPVMAEQEGRPIQSLVTRYERKRVNREACIQLKGEKCRVCGFDFYESYGDLGRGYIEVHHTKPVSTVGPGYRVDIANDLEPICANCHAMAHREDPPVGMARLRQIVEDGRGNKPA